MLRSKTITQKLNVSQLGIFLLFHAVTFYLLFQVSWAPQWLALGLGMHVLRFLGITVSLHRYFCHKAFRTSRFFQMVLALHGSLSLIRGPIRFASAHRYHHLHADTPEDLHSPQHGFWWSYVGWLMSKDFDTHTRDRVRDLRKFPELVWLDRCYWLPALLVAVTFYLVWGLEGLVWASLVSTLTTWHLAFFVTSVFHRIGDQDFETDDRSGNHLGLALLTLGEGWHNNHHRDMYSAQLGFKISQPDPGYWVIWLLEKTGLIWDVKCFDAQRFERRHASAPLKAPVQTSPAQTQESDAAILNALPY